MEEKRNILAVGAHPDDVELGCGGVIAKHLARGDSVYILVLTNGEQGKHTPKKEECHTSLKKLGVKTENMFFGNLPDGHLEDSTETVNLIEKYLISLKIDRVYTHDPRDRHQDHRKCSNAVSSAARNIPEIFLFQGPSTNVEFAPHFFIEVNEELFEKKLRALESYETQIAKGIVNLDAIESLGKYIGAQHKTKFAEAFAINHVLRGGLDV